VAVVRNGVDLARYPDPAFRPGEAVVIGFVGFVRAWHRVGDLVDALAAPGMPAVARLLVVGDGPARAELEERSRRLGVAERVRVTGAVGHEQVPALVASMDICVQPAATPWAAPLKLPEYMAAGRAVVAPDQENLREVLTHGRDALLFAPDSPEALQQALVRLARDAGLRERLGREARQTVEREQLTWDGAAQRVEAHAAACLKRSA